MKRTKYYKVVKLNGNDGKYYSVYVCGSGNGDVIIRKNGRVKVVKKQDFNQDYIEVAKKFVLKYSLKHKTKPTVAGTSIFAFKSLVDASEFAKFGHTILEGYGVPSKKQLHFYTSLYTVDDVLKYWKINEYAERSESYFLSPLPVGTILLDSFTPIKVVEF